MTAAAAPAAAPRPSALADTLVVAGRNLTNVRRQPQLLVFVVIQPVMFVLLFRYVFGGAVGGTPRGVSYVDFLIPGIITQTVTFGASNSAIGLAEDMSKGIVDRFRALPMSRSAVLAGRVASDAVRTAFTVVLMSLVGLLVGWRPDPGLGLVWAFLLAVAFGAAMSTAMCLVGLAAQSSEAAQAISFPAVFPLTFASAVFVPIQTMPGWLQAFAKVNPITLLATAVRRWTGLPEQSPDAWWQALLWIVAISLVFGALAVRRYRRIS